MSKSALSGALFSIDFTFKPCYYSSLIVLFKKEKGGKGMKNWNDVTTELAGVNMGDKTIRELERHRKTKYLVIFAGLLLGIQAPYWLEIPIIAVTLYVLFQGFEADMDEYPGSYINTIRSLCLLVGMALGNAGLLLFNLL